MEGHNDLPIEGGNVMSRYGLHGVFFSLFFTILTYCFPLVAYVLLDVSGQVEGLILSMVGFVGMLVALGLINTFLTESIWNIEMNDSGHALHGLVLFIMLFVSSFPQLIAYHMFPGPLTFLIMFVVYLPIHGYLALSVASVFVPYREENVWFEPRTHY
jgi:hypothetical protein